jgi:hypothetical protein
VRTVFASRPAAFYKCLHHDVPPSLVSVFIFIGVCEFLFPTEKNPPPKKNARASRFFLLYKAMGVGVLKKRHGAYTLTKERKKEKKKDRKKEREKKERERLKERKKERNKERE